MLEVTRSGAAVTAVAACVVVADIAVDVFTVEVEGVAMEVEGGATEVAVTVSMVETGGGGGGTIDASVVGAGMTVVKKDSIGHIQAQLHILLDATAEKVVLVALCGITETKTVEE